MKHHDLYTSYGSDFLECTIGNVRHIGLATCRTFPIVQSEKI